MSRFAKTRAAINRLAWQLPLIWGIAGIQATRPGRSFNQFIVGVSWGLCISLFIDCWKEVSASHKKFKADVQNIKRTGDVIEKIIENDHARRKFEESLHRAPWN